MILFIQFELFNTTLSSSLNTQSIKSFCVLVSEQKELLDYNGLVPAAKAKGGEEVESRYVSEFHDYREQLKKKTMARKADVAAQKARPHEFGQEERCDNKARMRGILI